MTSSTSFFTSRRSPLLSAALLLALAPAMVDAESASDSSTTAFDELWSYATLYKNNSNPILEEFKLRGRYQGQYHLLDSNQGDTSGWEDRRSRFGFDAKLFEKKVEVRVDFQSNDGFEDLYDRLVDAYVKWKPNDQISLTVGRQKPQIGYYDFLQSTNTQPTFERSQIFNQLRIDRATGAVLEGKYHDFTWQAGIYSNDIDREFGQFSGGTSFSAGIGYNAKESFGWDRADFRVDWLHSNHDKDDQVLNRYDNVVSATFWGQQDRYGLVVEGFLGTGGVTSRDGDVVGFYIQPTYDLIPKKLQLVGRYSFASGNGIDSVRAQSRYELEAPNLTGSGRGNQYNAFYLGGQYFIYGDKLKLLAGAEYATLSGGHNGGDYDGFTFLTGIRFSF